MIKKYKFIIAVCVIVIFCNFIVKLFIINKQANKISFLQQTIAAARSESFLKANKPDEHLFSEQDDITKIFQKIPDEFSFTEYASQIRALIDRNHLVVDNSLIFKPEATKMPDLLKFNTMVTITGGYGEIKALISDIQNMPGLVSLNSARISRIKDSQDKIRLNLELSVFFKRVTA